LCRFWCQLIFDSSLHHCIDSYLNEAPRPHDTVDATVTVNDQLLSLHRLFFLVCLRSSTHHESPTNFIDGKIFGDILYENYIFDIPSLMDICVVYGHGNDTVLVSKMIGNVFQQQPKYNDDLHMVVRAIEKVILINQLLHFTSSLGHRHNFQGVRGVHIPILLEWGYCTPTFQVHGTKITVTVPQHILKIHHN